MPPVGFEPTISALERAKTVQALDRAATVIGSIVALTFLKRKVVHVLTSLGTKAPRNEDE
jgi:hypothetical protein